MDEKELDQCIHCLPPVYGTRHFKNSISALSQVSGSERKDMARILLGCLVGCIPHDLMLTFHTLLDFIYISQYPTHDDQTLKYLEDALEVYHKHKHILKTLGIRDHLNIPKFHSLVHYADSIRSLGTTDNYNTEMFETLHIDCAKKAWRASNHRNERPQMTKWLERREKIAMFESLCARFAKALNQYIYSMKLGRPLTSQEQERASSYLPFSCIDTFHTLKFSTVSLSDDQVEHNMVRARPAMGSEPARFDSVVILRDDNAEATGVQGTRIGHVKVIFELLAMIYEHGSLNDMHAPEEWATQGPLMYVKWYANLPASADPVHMMYEVRKLALGADGTPIIPLSMIRQSCQLIPRFPKPKKECIPTTIPTDWTSESMLDRAQNFLLNNWATKYAYQTLW
ncbi:hypothetical protein FOMPIDRAFT_1122305 [Fomitopsis schrenkii]|uniref:Uncharacterized protein n=1 Tax=Fomitopsis schrenkii TaxID=2126942 RepID=S8FGE2_FOMSC|nr:hypothetical protein FOMPIDRAFT_1122305 [Fomitopsis schrenkii]